MRKNCSAILGEVDIHVAELFPAVQRSTYRFSRMGGFVGLAVVLVSPWRLQVGCSAATPSMRKNCLAILGEVDIHVAEFFPAVQRSTYR